MNGFLLFLSPSVVIYSFIFVISRRIPSPPPSSQPRRRTPTPPRPSHSPSQVLKVANDCSNTSDPVTLDEYTQEQADRSYPNDIVSIYLKSQQRQGECYSREELKEFWKVYDKTGHNHWIFLWKNEDENSITNKKLYKLPISGSWITDEAHQTILENHKKKFVLKSIGSKYMGGKNHFVSGVFGQKNEVFDI